MFLLLPTTSSTHPSSYHSPQLYGYPSNSGYYPRFGSHQFTRPSNVDFFPQPSAEELEEHEYQRALEVIAIHRRRQAEKEATIRQQQLAEVAHRQYFAALAAGLEQRRRGELLAARRVGLIRSQQARARQLAAERQHVLNAFLQQLKQPQPVSLEPHVVERNPLADVLKRRLAAESDVDIAGSIKNLLSALGSHSVESNKAQPSNEEAPNPIETFLSSLFPGSVFRPQPQSSPSTEQPHPGVSDKGKGKARVADIEESQKAAQQPESADQAFADILRHVIELSKSTPTTRSPDEAGPSGSWSSPSPAKPAVAEREQVQIDRAIALSSIEHIQNTLTQLRSNFVLPTELDHYKPSTDDRDEIVSVSSVSSSDLTKLIPYTSTNKPVYRIENELNGLLEELDRIDSHGDVEVREKRKEVAKAVEKALESIERMVGQEVEKRASLISTLTPATDGPLEGFSVDDDIVEEVIPTRKWVGATAAAYDVAVPGSSAPLQVEETVVIPAEVPSHFQEGPESNGEASTTTVSPVEFGPSSETELIEPGFQNNAPGAVKTLLPETVSSVHKPQHVDSDSDNEVVSLGSDAEKSDWSDLEH